MLLNSTLDHLYFLILPEQDPDTGIVLFHLNVIQGTWVSFEIHYAVSQGYVIEEIFEQHQFPDCSKTLFKAYKGLESIAKLLINGPTGKWSFNNTK